MFLPQSMQQYVQFAYPNLNPDSPGLIDPNSPPDVKARKFVDMLTAESGECVLMGEPAMYTRAWHHIMMHWIADDMERHAAFAGLVNIIGQKHAAAVNTALVEQPEALDVICQFMYQPPNMTGKARNTYWGSKAGPAQRSKEFAELMTIGCTGLVGHICTMSALKETRALLVQRKRFDGVVHRLADILSAKESSFRGLRRIAAHAAASLTTADKVLAEMVKYPQFLQALPEFEDDSAIFKVVEAAIERLKEASTSCETTTETFEVTIDACAQCGNDSDTLKYCAKCRTVQYCNRECQMKHWKAHKKSCRMAPATGGTKAK